jgi:hypothetical protein
MCTVPRNVCAIDVKSALLVEWRKLATITAGREGVGELADLRRLRYQPSYLIPGAVLSPLKLSP